MARRLLAILSAVAQLGVIPVAAPAQATQQARFAYTMTLTPMEGPTVPAVIERYTGAFAACQKLARVTQDNANCFGDEIIRQDAALNRTWQATIGRLSATERGALLVAERTWIAERDPFCRSAADAFGGGTIAPIVYLDCRVEQTIRRTIWLEHLR